MLIHNQYVKHKEVCRHGSREHGELTPSLYNLARANEEEHCSREHEELTPSLHNLARTNEEEKKSTEHTICHR
jgi:hypothetical protein